jgi:predicted nucleic-acid-binding Zn-ribbon protein
MKMFVCTKCGYADDSSNDSWKIVRKNKDIDIPAVIQCSKCDCEKLLTMQIDFTKPWV